MQAIDDEDELAIVDQLPEFVSNKLFCEFLFAEFLHTFVDTFKIYKPNSSKLMTWEDQNYRNFMLGILQSLEPRHEYKGTILFEELQEISEIIFISKGNIDIGYELNK